MQASKNNFLHNIQCIANKVLICYIFDKNSRNHTDKLSGGNGFKNVATIVVFSGIIKRKKKYSVMFDR